MGVDFSNPVVARHTAASLTNTNHEAKMQEDMGEFGNGMLNAAASPGTIRDPEGGIDPRTGKYTQNGGSLIEAILLPNPASVPKDAVKGGDQGTVGAAQVDGSGRPVALSDNLGRKAYSTV